MPTIRIDDPDDPRVDAYRDIRERDLVGRRGLFVAEGKVVLAVLLQARRFDLESMFVLDGRLDGVSGLIAQAHDIPVYVAGRALFDRVAGFPVHRGVLAIGRRRTEETAADLVAGLRPAALVMVLNGISNHDNMGALFRNAAAFGADAVLLDDGCCDPLYRKAIRVSVGAVLKVPYAMAPTAALADLLDGSGFVQYALSPRGRETIRDVERAPRTALWLGQEGHGLPDAVMQRMVTVRIPIVSDFDSLNVAAASAVALSILAPDPSTGQA